MTDAPRIPTQFIAPPDEDEVQHDKPRRNTCCDGISGLHTAQCPDHQPDAPERDAEAVEATPAAAAPPSGPTPLAAGTYAVYDDQQGGYVLVIGTREGETHHKHLPKNIVKMAEKMAGGANPLAMLFGGA